MSRKLEELKSDLNSHILNVINFVSEKRAMPSNTNAVGGQNLPKIQILTFGQMDRIKVI